MILQLINFPKCILAFKRQGTGNDICTQSLHAMSLQMIRKLVQRGYCVFTEVHVGFFAARRSLFHSLRANQHREVKYLVLVVMGCLFYQDDMHSNYDVTSVQITLHAYCTRSLRQILHSSIYSYLYSMLCCRYILPL